MEERQEKFKMPGVRCTIFADEKPVRADMNEVAKMFEEEESPSLIAVLNADEIKYGLTSIYTGHVISVKANIVAECEFCKDVLSFYRCKVSIKFKDGYLADLFWDRPANYCPNCGRKLT